MQDKLKETKGITLVALIITVIILLILAGVTISLVIGDNGLITKSKQGVGEYQTRAEEEKAKLDEFEQGIKEKSTDNEDSKAMKILVNSGEDGIVKLPIGNSEKDFEIDWGDGNTGIKQEDAMIINKRKIASRSSIKIADQIQEKEEGISHIYKEKNREYVIKIRGNLSEIDTYGVDSTEEKILKILQWGEINVISIDLSHCINLGEIANPTEKSFKDLRYICFSNCTSLTSIPENLFANCPNVTEFYDTFGGCTSLTSISENLFANCPNATNFEWTFAGCSLTSIPENLFANCPNVTSFYYTFNGCSSLTSIPERLFANCPNVTIFGGTFARCSNLTSIPENLFANCPNVTKFDSTFYECSNLTGNSIKLWSQTERKEKGIDENNGGMNCYYRCTKLTDYDEIPEYWK